jgi:hypothetical protein
MTRTSQRRALKNYRDRLVERGMARFEVVGLDIDRQLIRALARQLAENGPEASKLRATVSQSVGAVPPTQGGILAALRRSPLVGAELHLSRPSDDGRPVEL